MNDVQVFEELDKTLCRDARPSIGLCILRQSGRIQCLPELAALIGCPQDEQWHPEGDVWNHTLLVVDAAVLERTGQEHEDRVLMFAAMCHDMGKPLTTNLTDGRYRSLEHCEAGEAPTRSLLARVPHGQDIVEAVVKLVRHHLAPELLYAGKAGPAAVRRLVRRLSPETNVAQLVRLARADQFGRGNGEAQPRSFPAGDWLLAMADKVRVVEAPESPVLMGRHLIEAGLTPGPSFAAILKLAYEIQTAEGVRDPGELLRRAWERESR
jgi:tRNA nucleotidyltransferase (CCA-adding enzyme)